MLFAVDELPEPHIVIKPYLGVLVVAPAIED